MSATFFEIPLKPSTAQSLRASLSGVTYTIKIVWNSVSQCWVMDLLSADATTKILCGIPLVTGADLLGQYRYLDVGSHAVMLVATVGPGKSPDEVPGFNDLGVDGHLYYVTA